MISKLVTEQWKLVNMVHQLIGYVHGHNAQVGRERAVITFGEAQRPGVVAQLYAKMGIGIANSKHIESRAIDLKLYIDGVYQSRTEAYLGLGKEWERLGGIWGGRFKKPDGNHFEV